MQIGLTIAETNWERTTSFTVTAAKAGACTLTVSVASADPRYAALVSTTITSLTFSGSDH